MKDNKNLFITSSKIDVLMIIITLLFSLTGGFILFFIFSLLTKSDAEETVLFGYYSFSALMFVVPLLFAILGMWLTEYIRSRSYYVKRNGNVIASLIIVLILGGLLGGGGQYLYTLLEPEPKAEEEPEEEEEEVVITEEKQACDIVMLIDISSSMMGCFDNCKTASKTLVADLDKSSRLSICSFNTSCQQLTELNYMDKNGKDEANNAIESLSRSGATSMEPAFKKASEILEDSDDDRSKVVILLTDADDGMDNGFDSVVSKYKDENITLYSVCLDYSHKGSPFYDDIVDAVEETGGCNTFVERDSSGNVDLADLEKALGTIVDEAEEIVEEEPEEEEEEEEPEKEKAILFAGYENLSALRLLLRICVYILYGLLAAFAMYFTLGNALNAAVGAVISAVTALLLTLIGGAEIGGVTLIVCIVIFAVVYCTAVTKYYSIFGGTEER